MDKSCTQREHNRLQGLGLRPGAWGLGRNMGCLRLAWQFQTDSKTHWEDKNARDADPKWPAGGVGAPKQPLSYRTEGQKL